MILLFIFFSITEIFNNLKEGRKEDNLIGFGITEGSSKFKYLMQIIFIYKVTEN